MKTKRTAVCAADSTRLPYLDVRDLNGFRIRQSLDLPDLSQSINNKPLFPIDLSPELLLYMKPLLPLLFPDFFQCILWMPTVAPVW